MCLTNPDPEPTRKYGVGYKVVDKREDGQYECYDHYPHAGSVRYPLNKWITDPNTGEADTDGRHFAYPVGFHIMLGTSEARKIVNGNWRKSVRVIKVRFRQVVATQTAVADGIYGTQVVARRIMNLGEVGG